MFAELRLQSFVCRAAFSELRCQSFVFRANTLKHKEGRRLKLLQIARGPPLTTQIISCFVMISTCEDKVQHIRNTEEMRKTREGQAPRGPTGFDGSRRASGPRVCYYTSIPVLVRVQNSQIVVLVHNTYVVK